LALARPFAGGVLSTRSASTQEKILSKKTFLDFEQPIAELEAKIEELRYVQTESAVDISTEIDQLHKKSQQLTKTIYSDLNSWQITKIARHPERPYTMDYINDIFTDFVEMHGDRHFADDLSIDGALKASHAVVDNRGHYGHMQLLLHRSRGVVEELLAVLVPRLSRGVRVVGPALGVLGGLLGDGVVVVKRRLEHRRGHAHVLGQLGGAPQQLMALQPFHVMKQPFRTNGPRAQQGWHSEEPGDLGPALGKERLPGHGLQAAVVGEQLAAQIVGCRASG
jgi:hypothetical protein